MIFQKRVMTTLDIPCILQDIGTKMMGLGSKIARIMSGEAFRLKNYSRVPNTLAGYCASTNIAVCVYFAQNIVFK